MNNASEAARQMEMSDSALLGARTVWEDRRVHNLTITGLWVLRYGLVFFLLTFGSFKFFAFEAEGIGHWLQTVQCSLGYIRSSVSAGLRLYSVSLR